jgi:hypothetical protein
MKDWERLHKQFDSDAAECRSRGFRVGTRLVGDEGFGPTVMEITAIGEKHILAKTLSENGIPSNPNEGLWTLACRDWRVAP